MSLTETQARESMFSLLLSVWPNGVPLQWPNVEPKADAKKPTANDDWGRVNVQSNTSTQTSLTGVAGTRRFTRTGLLTVQVFTGVGKGLSRGEEIGIIIRNAFEGEVTPEGVWFRSAVIQPVGPSGGWNLTNVVVSYEYDEIR